MRNKFFTTLLLLCVSVMSWAGTFCNTLLTSENAALQAGDCWNDEVYFTASKTGPLETTFSITSTKRTLTGSIFNGQALMQNPGGGSLDGDFATGWTLTGNTLTKVATWTTYPTGNIQVYIVVNIDGAPPITGAQIPNLDVSVECGGGSCADSEIPTISNVATSSITSNSAVLTVTASDNVGVTQYVVKNGASQIASSATSPITLTGLSAGTTYDNIKVIAKDACNNESAEFAVTSFETLTRSSECSGDLGHWATPATKRISYTIEYLPIIDKIKYTVQGYGSEVLSYLQIRVASPAVTNSGDLAIVDGVATWFQNAPAAGTEMAVQFYYGLVSMGDGREITQDGEVSLSNPQSVYYKSHDCAAVGGPSTVPAAPDDKNDCQVYGIFGTEGFGNHATHAEWWDGALSYLTGLVDGKPVYFTTRGTTANIQYPSQNINAYDKLHFDIWTDAAREIGVELCINAGTHGSKQNITTTAGTWKSVDLDLTGFHDPKDVNTTFLLLSSLARETYYVANAYLYKTAADESCYADLNLALNKPVVAGYTPGNPGEAPTKVNDGDHGTEWTTWQNQPAASEWWYVDLGRAYQLTHIDVLLGNDISTNYILQTRLDAPSEEDKANDAAWTTVATVTDAVANTLKSSTINCAARYVRFHSLARSNVDLIRLKEIEVYGSGIADVDMEKPVMTSASLESKTHNQVILNVAATDNKGIASYHVVETTHSIDSELTPEAGKITITGLTPETNYSFVITAKDFFDNESDNNKSVVVTTNAYLTEPASACPAPTWPTDQVKAIYSPTYSADCGFGEWGSGSSVTDDTYGKKYIVGPNGNGYFGMVGFNLNCLTMEKLHYDIWVADNTTIRFVPIWGGAEQGITKNLTGQQWNSIDIDLSEYTSVTNWGAVTQVKLDQMTHGITFWVANAYFYRTTALVDDEDPTNVSASLAATGFYSIKLTVSAEDNSGAVSFSIKNGETEMATGAAASGVATTISVVGLNPGTNYNLNVIAKDDADNEAAPVAVAVTTHALPSVAPAQTIPAVAVKSLYSNEYSPAVALGNTNENWWQAPLNTGAVIGIDNVLCYENIPATSTFGWAFASLDAAGFQKLHVSIYPLNAGTIEFYPVIAPEGEFHRTSQTLVAEQWNEVVIDYTDKTFAAFTQLGFTNYSSLGAFVIDNVYFYKDPDFKRDASTGDDWMAPGELGTICIPNGAVATGGDIYELVGKDEIGKIVFSTVPNNAMEPGKPYLFQATSTAMNFYYTNATPAGAPDNSGAMKGTFVDLNLTELENVYYFAGHALWSCSDLASLEVAANRAYVKMDEVGSASPTPAPGRRYFTMSVNGKTTPTGVDEITNDQLLMINKVIIDGHLYILRGDKQYDATGRLVK